MSTMPAHETNYSKRKRENKKTVNLFDLPPEIRNLIYEHALITDSKVDLFRHCWHRTAKAERKAYRSLCLTSKQSKHEVQTIFLTKNHFELRMSSVSGRQPFLHHSPRPAYRWDVAKGVTNKLIRDLRKLTIRAVVHYRDETHTKPHTRPWMRAPVEIDIAFDKVGIKASCADFRQRELLLSLRQRRSVANSGMWVRTARSTGQRMVQLDEYLGTLAGGKLRSLSMEEMVGVVALIDDD